MPPTPHRVLVTGSRGKSSIVRLLHSGFEAAGIHCRARITGVQPQELGAKGMRHIERSSGAHVEEMRWWLRQLPYDTGAIVLENSAITPDLQHLAAQWLSPVLTVFSNAVADHQEAWGPDEEHAADALCRGVLKGGQVILPVNLANHLPLLQRLRARNAQLDFAEADPALASDPDVPAHRAVNLGLARAALRRRGLLTPQVEQRMRATVPGRFDFRVLESNGARVALAFSANDISSTRALFDNLGWRQQETTLVYNHRKDRPGRLASFVDWLGDSAWREVLIMGDRPWRPMPRGRYLRPDAALARLRQPAGKERIFGCGNIAGLPLKFCTLESTS